jgi:hypothetical protein
LATRAAGCDTQAHPEILCLVDATLLLSPRFSHHLSAGARNMAELRAPQIKSPNM